MDPMEVAKQALRLHGRSREQRHFIELLRRDLPVAVLVEPRLVGAARGGRYAAGHCVVQA